MDIDESYERVAAYTLIHLVCLERDYSDEGHKRKMWSLDKAIKSMQRGDNKITGLYRSY